MTTTHKFQQTYCSRCGKECGPGDSGYSRCLDHDLAACRRMVESAHSLAQASIAEASGDSERAEHVLSYSDWSAFERREASRGAVCESYDDALESLGCVPRDAGALALAAEEADGAALYALDCAEGGEWSEAMEQMEDAYTAALALKSSHISGLYAAVRAALERYATEAERTA